LVAIKPGGSKARKGAKKVSRNSDGFAGFAFQTSCSSTLLRDVVVGDRFLLRRLEEALELAGGTRRCGKKFVGMPLDAEAEERLRVLDRLR
jgi:hypothetical protein